MRKGKDFNNKQKCNGKGGKYPNSTNAQQRRFNSKSRGNNNRSDSEPSDSGMNDSKWYATDPALLRDAASIPYSWATGTKVSLNIPVLETLPNKGQFTIPGICVINTAPSAGNSMDSTSAINVAANSVYTWIRSYNSGSKNYDAPDLMIYLLAMSQFYAFINWCQRLYGALSLCSSYNRYLPEALVRSMGVDYDDMVDNVSQFRYWINMFINKVASLAVPNTMPFFNQQAFLYKDIYVEGQSVKDQLYMYNPAGFWKYKLNTDASGMLEYVGFPGNKKFKDIVEFGKSMLAPIIGDEDFNIMSGDIVKAYGSNIIKLASLPEVYPLVPVYNLTVLEQMKNAVCVGWGTPGIGDTFNVVQSVDHDYLIHDPSIAQPTGNTFTDTMNRLSLGVLAGDRMTITAAVEATPEITIENTRLMVACTDYNKGDVSQYASIRLHPGNVIPMNYGIYYYKVEASGVLSLAVQVGGYGSYLNVDSTDAALDATRTWNLEQCFKFHPQHYVLVFRNGSTAPAVNIANGYLTTDVDNYAVLTNTDLIKMHDTALLNMLNAKPIAKL